MRNIAHALILLPLLAVFGCGQENGGTRQNVVAAAPDGGTAQSQDSLTAYNGHKYVLGTQVDCPGGNWINVAHAEGWFNDPSNPYWVNFNTSTPSGNGGRVITRICTYLYGCQNCYDRSPYSGSDTTSLSITNNAGPGTPVTVSAFGNTQIWVTTDAYDWQCQQYNGCP